MGHSYCALPTSNATGTDAFMMLLAAGEQPTGTGPTNSGFIVSSTIRAIAARYQEYLYLPGTKLHWEPRVPVTSTGNYWVGWIDNPELLLQMIVGPAATRRAIVQSVDTVRVYPIWQSSVTPIGPPRKKSYNVNTTLFVDTVNLSETTVTIHEIERSVQGAFVFIVDGAPPNITVAQPYISEQISLRGLTGLPITTT